MPDKFAVLKWLSVNRGVCTKVAKKTHPPVTPQYVAMVLHGKRQNALIERLLREHGAPIR